MAQNKTSKNKEQKQGWLFIGPSFIPLLVITIGPMLFLYYVSLTNYDLGTQLFDAKFVGFDNFVRLFSGKDREFWVSVKNTLSLSIAATCVELALGFLIALTINSLEKIRGFLVSVLMLPMVVTPVIVGLTWKLMLNSEHGVVNWILSNTIGLSPTWLGPTLSMLSVMMVEVWQWTPFVTLILLSGLSSLPVEPFEAAAIDGANPFQAFLYVTLPLLRPIILLALLFRLIDVLKIFDIVYIMTGGGPGSSTEVLSIHSYRLGFVNTGWIGRASATAVILTLLTVVISNIMIKQLQKSYQER
jgi:multiple sugar transport system permease protein